MTSITSNVTSIPQASPSTNSSALSSSTHARTPSVSGQTSSSAAVQASAPALRQPSYAVAAAPRKPLSTPVIAASTSPHTSAGVSAHNARPPTAPPAVNGKIPLAVTNSGPSATNGIPTHSTGGPHSRKPSLGAGGPMMPNGGAIRGVPPITFGAINEPGHGPASSGSAAAASNPSLTAPVTSNQRASSPQSSPSPVVQPMATGGAPPGQATAVSGRIQFGDTTHHQQQQGRPMSMPLVPVGPVLMNNLHSHQRRESTQSAHGDTGPSHLGHGPRGGMQSGRRGGHQPYQNNHHFNQQNQYNNGYGGGGRGGGYVGNSHQGRGPPSNMINQQAYGGPGPVQGYPNSPRNMHRSPALSHVSPSLAPVQPMATPQLYPPQSYMPPQGFGLGSSMHYDPNQAYMYNQQAYMNYSQMAPPHYQMPQQTSPIPQYRQMVPPVNGGYSVYPTQPMSRQGSTNMGHMEVPGRPTSSMGQMPTPTHTPQPIAVPPANLTAPSSSFSRPQGNKAIPILNPATGAKVKIEKSQASPVVVTSAPVIVSSPSPAPGRAVTRNTPHSRSTSTGGKTEQEKREEVKKREDMKATVAKKLEEERLIAEEAKKEEEKKRIEAEKKAAEEKLRLEKEEEERKAKEEEERKAKEEEERRLKEEEERRLKEAEKARIEAEEAAKKAEEEKLKKEAEAEAEAEAARLAQEKAAEEAKIAKEKAEEEARIAAEKLKEEEAKAEAERAEKLKEEEALAKAKVEAEAKAAEEAAEAAALKAAQVTASIAKPSAPDSESMPPPPFKSAEKPRPKPTPLNLQIKTNEPGPPSAALTALKSARFIENFGSVNYPSHILSPNPALNPAALGKFKYEKDFLLQFQTVFTEKPTVDWDKTMRDTVGEPDSGRPQTARTLSGLGPRSSSRSSGASAPPPMGAFGNFKGVGLPANMMTSDQRFQQSMAASLPSNPLAMVGSFTSVRSGGVGLMRSGSSSSLAGANHMPQSPRIRSSRGGSRKGGGAPMEKSESRQGDKSNQPTISISDVKPLPVSENRWKPRSIGTAKGPEAAPTPSEEVKLSPELVQRKVKAALNKMTPEKFDKISDQILEITSQSKFETDGRTLRQVIQLTFEKATDEAAWSSMYAKFCKRMLESMDPNIKDEGIRDKNNQIVTGGNLFRKYLLNRCQEEFERGWKINLPPKPEGVSDEAVMLSDEYYIAAAAKRRGLGLVQFIGELFKLGMLTERIMNECVRKLLDFEGLPEDETVESLCKLLKTIGYQLDTSEKSKGMMDMYFHRISRMSEDKDLNSRMRFMLMDIIDLRRKKWETKEADKGPKTIQEVREDALKAQAEKEAASRANNQRRPGGGRGSDRSFSQGFGNQMHPNNWQDQSKGGTVNAEDLRKLKSRQVSSGTSLFGPGGMLGGRSSSSGGSRRGFGSSGSQRGMEDSNPSSRTATPKPTTSHANMFSLLGDSGSAHHESGESNDATSPPASSPPTASARLEGSRSPLQVGDLK